jgi:hypothetical protein
MREHGRQWIWALVLVAAPACQGYPFSYQSPGGVHILEQHARITEAGDTDILFVIDNSTSMQDKQENLKRNASTFINVLAESNNNYHIGIVTTDMQASTDRGRLRMAVPGPPFLSRPDPRDPNAPVLKAALVDAFIQTIDSLGTSGSSSEAALNSAHAALDASKYPDAATANTGFLRPDAALAVIILTDEDDCSFKPEFNDTASVSSSETDTTACYVQTDKLADAATFVDTLAVLKGGDIGKVRAALIGGGAAAQAGAAFEPRGCRPGDGGLADTACGCWSYSNDPYFCTSLHEAYGQPCTDRGACPSETCPAAAGGACNTPRCSATPANRYTRFLDALAARRQAKGLSAGTFADSICQSDYHDALLAIAREVVLSSCFGLAVPASDPATVAVSLSRATDAGEPGPSQLLPRLDSQDPGAGCHSCGECPGGAWHVADPNTLCLDCGLAPRQGDDFKFSILQETSGDQSN